jgi:hypothetical protein
MYDKNNKSSGFKQILLRFISPIFVVFCVIVRIIDTYLFSI